MPRSTAHLVIRSNRRSLHREATAPIRAISSQHSTPCGLMLSVDAEQLQAVTGTAFARSCRCYIKEYLIYDPQNTAAISHLTHASDPVDHDGRAHTRGRRSAVIENYPLSVVSIPRFIEHSLREFLEASPDTSVPQASRHFSMSCCSSRGLRRDSRQACHGPCGSCLPTSMPRMHMNTRASCWSAPILGPS